MSLVQIACPSCGFSRQVPADKIPAGARSVTCPQCKTAFPLQQAAPPAAAVTAAQQPPPPQPPEPEPAPPVDGQPETPPRPPRPRRERPVPRKTLPEIGTLFSATWAVFQRRFAVLIGLYLLSMVAFITPPLLLAGAAFLAGGGSSVLLPALGGGLGGMLGIYFGFRCFGAFLFAVADDRLGFGEALEQGRRVIFPLIWVGLLTGFIISGGFLLFVIPGIIFIVWFFFAQFIVISEDVRGMGALLKSREYVRGEWFDVALRLLLVWAASLLLGMVPLAGPLLTIVFLPYLMIFHYRLYRDLQTLKGEIPYPCSGGDLIKWPAVALTGYIVIPGLLLLFVGGTVIGKVRQFSPAGITISSPATPAAGPTLSADGYRVIDFPAKDDGTAATSGVANPGEQTGSGTTPAATLEETPQNIHVFIYAVNYRGVVRANGVTLKEMEGKTDMQYNYNMGGERLKYGDNRLDVDYNEVEHPGSLLEIHIRISRQTPGKEREILGEWRLNDKGSGTKSFDFTIPKPAG